MPLRVEAFAVGRSGDERVELRYELAVVPQPEPGLDELLPAVGRSSSRRSAATSANAASRTSARAGPLPRRECRGDERHGFRGVTPLEGCSTTRGEVSEPACVNRLGRDIERYPPGLVTSVAPATPHTLNVRRRRDDVRLHGVDRRGGRPLRPADRRSGCAVGTTLPAWRMADVGEHGRSSGSTERDGTSSPRPPRLPPTV